ncbi:MAG: hypothetical protein RMM31_02830, partial [Anaerolineae bacterium]|nr:hypothetical protein [Anaerolineae bacterium]
MRRAVIFVFPVFGAIASLFLLARPSHASDVVVYTDSLSSGWQDWSWHATVNFNNASPARDSRSIAMTLNQPWAGLSLRVDNPGLPGSPYEAVSFWVHGGNSGTRYLRFYIDETDHSQPGTPAVNFDAPAGVWTQFTISLAALGNPVAIKRLNIADRTGSAQPTFYVDDIRIISRTSPLLALAANVTVQANTVVTPLSPYLRASNLPAWLGETRLNDATFRARAAASGITLLRLPGGSWSNSYGWLSCELRQNHPSRQPCGPGWESWVARPRDFIAFLKATGMEGMWVVSPLGTSKEAAAAVAYFNGSPTDNRVIGVDLRGTDWYTVGRWAQLRVQAGFTDPVNIKRWEFGNEVYASKPHLGGSLCQSWG